MSNKVKWTLLGVGSSSGTPVIACQCETCLSTNPKNKRTRASAYIQSDDQCILIDTGPDLRIQALRENLKHVDAVLYTHPHADHLNGIDDLRAFCYAKQGVIDVYGDEFTIKNIQDRFAYTLFPPSKMWDKPVLSAHVVKDVFTRASLQIEPIVVEHGPWPCLGWRIGNVAYLTDVSNIPKESEAKLQGLEVLFLDCLREEAYPSHLNVEGAFAWAAKLKAKRTVLIHMVHNLEFEALQSRCPAGVEVGFDGFCVEVESSAV